MSNNRIITPNGHPPEPDKPMTMQELLNSAHNDWKFKRKDEAFMKVLSAMALMSAGVAQAMKMADEAKALIPKPPETPA